MNTNLEQEMHLVYLNLQEERAACYLLYDQESLLIPKKMSERHNCWYWLKQLLWSIQVLFVHLARQYTYS